MLLTEHSLQNGVEQNGQSRIIIYSLFHAVDYLTWRFHTNYIFMHHIIFAVGCQQRGYKVSVVGGLIDNDQACHRFLLEVYPRQCGIDSQVQTDDGWEEQENPCHEDIPKAGLSSKCASDPTSAGDRDARRNMDEKDHISPCQREGRTEDSVPGKFHQGASHELASEWYFATYTNIDLFFPATGSCPIPWKGPWSWGADKKTHFICGWDPGKPIQ